MVNAVLEPARNLCFNKSSCIIFGLRSIVVGCLIVIAVILLMSYGLGNQSSYPSCAQANQPSMPRIPEKRLIVIIKTINPDFITKPETREFHYQDLKGQRFQRVDGGLGYSGPALEEILNLTTPYFQKIVAHDEGNQARDIGKDASYWIIAIDQNNNPLPPENGGPYMLLNR
jgi:hypothetical protein